MKGTKFIVLLIILMSMPSADAETQKKFKPPPNDHSLWGNSFYVLVNDDKDAKKTQKTIEKLLTKDVLGLPVGSLRKHIPVSVSTFLPMKDNTNRDKKRKESARSKLGRYLIVHYPDDTDLSVIFESFKNDPDIIFFGVEEIESNGSELRPVLSAGGGQPIIEEDKLWGFDEMQAGEAHEYQYGHAFIGVADQGLDPTHTKFQDYDGNTWKEGNFHPALSFNINSHIEEPANPTAANPFSSYISMGTVDGYHLHTVIPWFTNASDPLADLSCDKNNNGASELKYVGHGSHVTGIIAAKYTAPDKVTGVCRECPLGIAQYNYIRKNNSPYSYCFTLGQYTHPDQSPVEGNDSQSNTSVWASIGILIDMGVQVVNYSGGMPEMDAAWDDDSTDINSSFCTSNSNSPYCLILDYAESQEVIIVASAGNFNDNELHFPAADIRVVGVSGIENGGAFWNELPGRGPEHGSSYGSSGNTAPTFSAPAKNIYSTMYEGKQYNWEIGCDDRTDSVQDGYGYCTGTSMSAPFITGVAGLVRSTNPLAGVDDVIQVMKDSTTRSSSSYTLGWGTPRADIAVKDMLGKSGNLQVLNRVTPLFSLYGFVAEDIVQTTKPQVAAAFNLNSYVPYSSEALVNGYTIPEPEGNQDLPTDLPRADIFILTTHNIPASGRTVKPLYRMRWVGSFGGNPYDTDWTLALESEISGSSSFKAVGYELDGIEGYIYSTCTPESTCRPDGTVIIYRAYNSPRDDHAVFPESKKSHMQSIGYTSDLVKLGYAYPNQDSDVDGVIDGMEYILGTNPNIVDSDCDGISDGVEYPMVNMPASDPMDGSCGGAQEQTPWGSNSGAPTGINNGWNYALGYHFTPSVGGVVTKLGGYFNGTKTVRLFNKTSGTQLAAAIVSSNNNWSYSTITPVAVVAGETYTVAAYLSGSDGSYKSLVSSNYFPNTYGNITIEGSTFAVTSSDPDTRPTNSALKIMYGQADIEFVPD